MKESVLKLKSQVNILKEQEKKYKYLEVLEMIVSEDGAKKFIIKDLVQVLNNRIQKYLEKTGALFTAMFDDSFNCEFLTESGPCSYENFSRGEQARINLAIIFTFKDILSNMGNISSNILVLDELLDLGLDDYAITAFASILKELSKSTTVFVVSHKENMIDVEFDNIIELVKQNGFTIIKSDSQGE